MGELIPFQKKEPGRKKEGTEKTKNILWGRLDEAIQQMFVQLQREISASKRINQAEINPKKLEEQRQIVGGWSDEQVLEFISNLENREALKSKPHLVMALFERVSGKL